MCSLHHFTGDDVKRATKGIRNAAMAPKTTIVPTAIVGKVIQSHCCNNVMKDATDDRYGRLHKVYAKIQRAPIT
jgi:hypothetical protein